MPYLNEITKALAYNKCVAPTFSLEQSWCNSLSIFTCANVGPQWNSPFVATVVPMRMELMRSFGIGL